MREYIASEDGENEERVWWVSKQVVARSEKVNLPTAGLVEEGLFVKH
jgi:hypothetical protein